MAEEKKPENDLLADLNAKLDELNKRTRIFSSGWKIFGYSFLSGIARGLGTVIGMTLVIALIVYFITKILVQFVDLPVIGYYIAQLVEIVNENLARGVKVR